MLDQLSERLQGAFHTLGERDTVTEADLDAAFREIRRALLEADVNLRAIKSFVSRVKERALGEEVLKTLSPDQHLVGIVYEELIELLGKEEKPLVLEPGREGDPALILMFGLQGSGKTTTCGKLAKKLLAEGKKPLLVAADVYRPAAIGQLITLGKQVHVPVHTIDGSNDMLHIAETAIARAKADGHDVVIIDTAGRLQVDTGMMAELLVLERSLQPKEKLLVIDAMMGQEAVPVAEAFHTQLTMTGVVITKLDGDARGGAILSVVEATSQPIKYIGVSEKLDGLEVFHPDRLASRILGMGDVLSLVEKAQQAVDEEEVAAMEAKMRKAAFSITDFMKLQKQMKFLGGLEGILGMLPIPGMNKEMRESLAHGGEKQFARIEAMVNSMTPAERDRPEIIEDGRKARIAKGCGVPVEEVDKFLTQFEQMRAMMQQLTQITDLFSGKASASDDGEDEDSAEEAVHPSTTGGLTMKRSMGKKKKKKEEEDDDPWGFGDLFKPKQPSRHPRRPF